MKNKAKSHHILISFLLFCLFFSSCTQSEKKQLTGEQSWESIASVEDVCSAYPERIEFLMESLDLEAKGLEKTKIAYEKGNLVKAGKELLKHYKNTEIKNLVKQEKPKVADKTDPSADSIMADIITVQRVTDRIPRLENGHLNWNHLGPANDKEFGWLFNRHSDAGTLFRAWFDTGNPKYAKYLDKFIKDWIISSWPYPGVKSSTSMWRGLEVTARARIWMPIFYNLIDTKYLSPATQLLILSSLPEHAHYLRNFHAQGNWLTMEMNGLATVGSAFPEYKESAKWLEYAIDAMTESMKDQVYPDGVQTELTSHYHHVAMSNFRSFLEVCNRSNVKMPEFYSRTVEDMWNYLASTMKPDGYGLLNNDSDKNNNRKSVLNAAENYKREDWKYIATNGESGSMPANGPSFVFPWAGQMISRSGYDKEAQWSFFDIGPWGSGHQHNDKLHISIAAFGRDLLVDAGRFAYTGEVARKFRKYATGSYGHNVILVDGKGQGPGPRVTTEPLSEKSFKITKDFDFASGSFDNFTDVNGKCVHSRSLFYVRGQFWAVVDKISTDRPRKIETLWHWHPDCKVQEAKNGIISTMNNRGNLAIIPVGDAKWNIRMAKGQEEPEMQGWYSTEYNVYVPNTVSIYSAQINSESTFIWLLMPSETGVQDVRAEATSKNRDGVSLRVTYPDNRQWDIFIPYSDSNMAQIVSAK